MQQIKQILDTRLANPGDTMPVTGHLDEKGYSLGGHDFVLPDGTSCSRTPARASSPPAC